MAGPTPLTLIGGFLGAGKTSLLEHLLSSPDGRRLAVLVNDFGAVNIDARLIESVVGESVSLANGCVCCSIRGDLLAALVRMSHRDPAPDHIVVELSGVSRLAAVTETFTRPEVASRFEVRSTITVVDAEAVAGRAGAAGAGGVDHRLAIDQLRFADLVVLNKTDLVPRRLVDTIRVKIERAVARSRVWETSHGMVPPELVLGDAVDRRGTTGFSSFEPGADAAPGHQHVQFDSWTLRVDRPWPLMVVHRLVEALPAEVYRGKGFVRLDLRTGDHGEFQMTGRRAWLKLRPPDQGADRDTELVFVGTPGCLTDDGLERLAGAAEEDHLDDQATGRSHLVGDLRSFEMVFA